MALSEAEQELLARLEASLAAEDPKLAQKLAEAPVRRVHPRRATLGVVGILVGITLLVLGLSVSVWLSVVGFVLMLAATIFFISAWRTPAGGAPAIKIGPAGETPSDFMSRLEQRWKERMDPDDE
ncbi:MAG: DUF3040 domain-containing protein [Propionibacteriaceae bacterium]|jgi:protein-S-isoprenylcysteine O-methyltransferase Ste14|nr:DUF3040 domain-containing protein [Propionibacteriaceae bacterium]